METSVMNRTRATFSFRADMRAARQRLAAQQAFTVSTPYGVVQYGDRGSGPPVLAIHAPTLICHGRDDPGLPFHGAITLAQQIPGARLVAWDRGGHLGLGDHPDIKQAIQDALRGAPGPLS
jgi:pimeloyl-ACP methyl ester carboxylesterase